MMSLGQDCNIFYLLSDEDNAVMVGWAHSFWTSCVVSMMLVGALGGNDTIPTAATLSHPERMLARFLPGHHHVQSRIQRQGPVFIQSGVRDATVPVVVLHGDVQQTIHALGLEGCTSRYCGGARSRSLESLFLNVASPRHVFLSLLCCSCCLQRLHISSRIISSSPCPCA